MIKHTDWQLAMRARALTLSVATTGAISIEATATGYIRATGSFLTDGLARGMEFTATGFGVSANNGVHVIKDVTALAIICSGTVVEAAAGGRTLTVGLPGLRAWENVRFEPDAARPYVVEQYLPGPPPNLETMGVNGWLVCEPMYALAIYALKEVGLAGVSRYSDAVISHFAPKTALTLASGDVLRVRGDTGPFRGQLRQDWPGWAVVPVTIPFRIRTQNTL